MDFSDQTTTNFNTSPAIPPAINNERRTRKPRSAGRVMLFIVAFFTGIIVALLGLLGYILFFASATPVASPSSPSTGAILVQTKTAFMTAVVRKNMNTAGLPGQLQNAQVSFTHNGPMMITADMKLGILGIDTTRQLTLALQPYISSCQFHVHVLHADLQGLPITIFAQGFENQINNQMQMNVSGLPSGFNYCVTNIHTEPDGLYLTYSATPT